MDNMDKTLNWIYKKLIKELWLDKIINVCLCIIHLIEYLTNQTSPHRFTNHIKIQYGINLILLSDGRGFPHWPDGLGDTWIAQKVKMICFILFTFGTIRAVLVQNIMWMLNCISIFWSCLFRFFLFQEVFFFNFPSTHKHVAFVPGCLTTLLMLSLRMFSHLSAVGAEFLCAQFKIKLFWYDYYTTEYRWAAHNLLIDFVVSQYPDKMSVFPEINSSSLLKTEEVYS